MYPEDVDEVDILFARLQPAHPPLDLHDRVMSQVQRRARRRRLVDLLCSSARSFSRRSSPLG